MSTEVTDEAYKDPGTPEEMSRRGFLAKATIVMGNVVALGVAIPVVASLFPTREVLAGMSGTTADKSWWPLNKSEMSQLQANVDKPIKIFFNQKMTDGYIDTEMRNYVWGIKLKPGEEEKMRSSRPDLFANPAGKVPYLAINMGFVMFSPICPHLGCNYDWNDSAGKFICPCHGSVYTRLGEHVAGPAPRGLDPLQLRERSGVAQIQWIRFKNAEPARLVISYT